MTLQDFKETKHYGRTHTQMEGQRENSSSCFPAIHDYCCLLSHLLMYFGGLYCKKYRRRSDCSLIPLFHTGPESTRIDIYFDFFAETYSVREDLN